MTCRSALLLTLELLGSLWKSFKAAALAFCWGLLECISLGRVRRPDERARVKERLRAQLAAASGSGRENVEAIVDVVAAEKSGGLSLEEPISPSKVETRSSSSSSSSSSSRSGAPLTPVSPSAASLRSTGATTTDMAINIIWRQQAERSERLRMMCTEKNERGARVELGVSTV